MELFELKVKYQRNAGEDVASQVKESYIVEAESLSDAEKRLFDEIAPYIVGESEIKSCNAVRYYDIVNGESGDTWFKCKVELIIVEESGKERRKGVYILVQSKDIERAVKDIKHYLVDYDCEIVNVARTPIAEVYRNV